MFEKTPFIQIPGTDAWQMIDPISGEPGMDLKKKKCCKKFKKAKRCKKCPGAKLCGVTEFFS